MVTTLAEQIDKVMKECLCDLDEINTDSAVKVECITKHFTFHFRRIKAARHHIKVLLDKTPSMFHKRLNGIVSGASFLDMCRDEQGKYRPEYAATMEELVALGLITGMAELSPVSKQWWPCCPDGMPFVLFTTWCF